MSDMHDLIKKLNQASKAYYNENRSIMSDNEFDKLYDELIVMENESGVILPDSPTQNVGFIVMDELKKVRHESRMLSLNKVKDWNALKDFLGTNEGLLSWKLDGLTIVITYRDGKMFSAVTRGNGEIGEDITHNAVMFKNIPSEIDFKGELILRGEAVISYPDFENVNEMLPVEKKYKNPRNLTSGTVRQLNNRITKERKVRFIVFTVVKADGIGFSDLKEEMLNWAKNLGFEVVEFEKVNSENILSCVSKFHESVTTHEIATDGLVLTFNSIRFSAGQGMTSKFPKDSLALKWADETAETILTEVDWNTSRTGLINPVAVFDPVELEGTTVERASLHNVSVIESLQLGIGDTIKVYKANMIIPQISENLTKSDSLEIPTICPTCSFETEIIQTVEGKALYCLNPNCHAQRVQSLTHYASRNAMNIEGLSEETINTFISSKFLENFTDIYNLKNYKEQITKLSGFGEKSFQKITNSIERSKTVSLPNFIYALGIKHIGLSNAKLLCNTFNNDVESIKKVTYDELMNIDGFGEVISNSLIKYFSNEYNLNLFNIVLPLLHITTSSQIGNSLADLSFVITGDLVNFSNRNELKDLIEQSGGKITNSVTSKTNYLINNDATSSSSKNKKAKELGIEIITEAEFLSNFPILLP